MGHGDVPVRIGRKLTTSSLLVVSLESVPNS